MEHFTFTLTSVTSAGGSSDTLRFTGSGRMKKTADGWLLRYTGSDRAGNSVTSSLKLWDDGRRAVIINDAYLLTLDAEADTDVALPAPGGTFASGGWGSGMGRLHWTIHCARAAAPLRTCT